MTIGDYIRQLQAVNPQELAVAAIDENSEAITDYTTDCWVTGTNPDGERTATPTATSTSAATRGETSM